MKTVAAFSTAARVTERRRRWLPTQHPLHAEAGAVASCRVYKLAPRALRGAGA